MSPRAIAGLLEELAARRLQRRRILGIDHAARQLERLRADAVPLLPHHHHLPVVRQRHDVAPVGRVEDPELVLAARARMHQRVRVDAEDLGVEHAPLAAPLPGVSHARDPHPPTRRRPRRAAGPAPPRAPFRTAALLLGEPREHVAHAPFGVGRDVAVEVAHQRVEHLLRRRPPACPVRSRRARGQLRRIARLARPRPDLAQQLAAQLPPRPLRQLAACRTSPARRRHREEDRGEDEREHRQRRTSTARSADGSAAGTPARSSSTRTG